MCMHALMLVLKPLCRSVMEGFFNQTHFHVPRVELSFKNILKLCRHVYQQNKEASVEQCLRWKLCVFYPKKSFYQHNFHSCDLRCSKWINNVHLRVSLCGWHESHALGMSDTQTHCLNCTKWSDSLCWPADHLSAACVPTLLKTHAQTLLLNYHTAPQQTCQALTSIYTYMPSVIHWAITPTMTIKWFYNRTKNFINCIE